VLLVRNMLFIAFNEDNLKLLAVIGGHVGDLLREGPAASERGDQAQRDFLRHLRRGLEDRRRYDLPVSIVTLAIVRSSRCGFRTTTRISPGENSTRLMSNRSAGGRVEPTRSTSDEPVVTTMPTAIASSTTGTTTHTRRLTRPEGVVADPAST
jgi:hypothetical protein